MTADVRSPHQSWVAPGGACEKSRIEAGTSYSTDGYIPPPAFSGIEGDDANRSRLEPNHPAGEYQKAGSDKKPPLHDVHVKPSTPARKELSANSGLPILSFGTACPWIVAAALKNRQKHIPDLNAQHGGRGNDEVQLYAVDILVLDGDDLRSLPLSMRKANLERLLARRPEGVFVNPLNGMKSVLISSGLPATWVSKVWCRSGVIGLIRPPGRSIGSKVKNRKHPAMERVADSFR